MPHQPGLSGEDFRERVYNSACHVGMHGSKAFHEATLVHGAELVQGNVAISIAETSTYAAGIIPQRGRQGSNDYRSQVTVHFVRGYDHAGARFTHFGTDGWIENDDPSVEAA